MSAWQAARDPTRFRVSRMLSDLLGDRPGLDADAGTRATWFDRRAEVFDRLAEAHSADGDVLRAGESRAAADEARATAANLHQQAQVQNLDTFIVAKPDDDLAGDVAELVS